MPMSKRCIPYTPHLRDLKESIFALVTTTGIHLRSQPPYQEDDNSWRIIPGTIETDELTITHEHYDHQDADRDINCIFPIDRLRELAQEGIIGGVSEKHLGFGFTQNLRDLYERAAPELAKVVLRSKADGVILTAGCPLCHRVASTLAREIEMTGLSTVLITVALDATRQAGPPRAIAPKGFELGHSLGRAFQKELQRQVLLDSLRRWEAREEPGHIWEIDYPAYGSTT
jgi:D-proline reductase (dithiol) PrdB